MEAAAGIMFMPTQQSLHLGSSTADGARVTDKLSQKFCAGWLNCRLKQRTTRCPDFVNVTAKEALWTPTSASLEAAVKQGTAHCDDAAELRDFYGTSDLRKAVNNRLLGSLSLEGVHILCDRGSLNEATQAVHLLDQQGRCVSTVILYHLLHRCIVEKDLTVGRKVHGIILWRGLESDAFLGSQLIRMFTLFGSLLEANQVFSKLPKTNLFVWTAIISANAKLGKTDHAIKLYHQLHNFSLELDGHVFVAVLKACSSISNLEQGRGIHVHIVECGLDCDVFVGSTLIDMYVKCGSLKDAHTVFDDLSERNIVTWNALISGYAHHGKVQEALHLFRQMQLEEIEPVRITFICFLKAFSSGGALEHGRQMHALVVEYGLELVVSVGNTLVSMYAKCGSLSEAQIVFDRLSKRDVVTWNVLIAGYTQHGQGLEALKLYGQMEVENVEPDRISIMCVLKACSSIASLEHGRQIHAQIIGSRFTSDLCVNNTLIDMYAKCGSLVDAHLVFDRSQRFDVVTWSALIAGHAEGGNEQQALQLFTKMKQEGIVPNAVTFVCVLKACSSIADIEQGRWIHMLIIRIGLELDMVVGNALTDMYMKCNSLVDAHAVFDQLPKHDVVAWSMLLAGYARFGCGHDALKLFEHMQQEGLEPDQVTFVSVLKACSSIADSERGRSIHGRIIEFGFESDIFIGSALIDMYAKCGHLKDAHMVFDGLPKQTVVTWNTLMTGYTQHGNGQEVLQLFHQMEQDGIRPDLITFVCVLKACASRAALQRGQQLHAYIIEDGLELDRFLGSTLIDMYAKCGSLEDAFMVFKRLPEQGIVAWNALIAGSAQHSDYPLALQIFKDMQQTSLKPDEVTFLSLLSACSHGNCLEEGLLHFKYMREDHGIVPRVEHHNCIVDLLGQAGRLSEAEDLLETVPFQRNIMGWTSLLNACRICTNIDVGRRCFDRIVSLDHENVGVYVLMSNIYIHCGMWEDAEKIQKLRRQTCHWKKPAQALIEIDNYVHDFIVGDKGHPRSHEIYTKLKTLSLEMEREGYKLIVESMPVSILDQDKEGNLCGHCEKLAIAFGLICTQRGTTVRVAKNLRMCADCHNATKLISKIEMREIIVRDTYCIHQFKNGECSCKVYCH